MQNNVLVIHSCLKKASVSSSDEDNYWSDRELMESVMGISNFDESESQIVFGLNTKYYTAKVCFHFWNVQKHNVCPFDWKNLQAQVIIGVPDYQSDMVLECVSKYKDEVESGLIYHVDEPSEKIRNEIQHWCVENNFELIVKNYKKASGDEESDIIEDKQGLSRLVEALECTTWPDMVRCTPKTTTETKKEVKTEAKKENTQVMTTEELLSKELQEKDEIEEDVEKETKFFETLMSEMMFLRREGGNLSVGERKQRAGDAALKLLAMMGEELDDEEAFSGDEI